MDKFSSRVIRVSVTRGRLSEADAAAGSSNAAVHRARELCKMVHAYFAVTTMAWRVTSIPLLSTRNSIV